MLPVNLLQASSNAIPLITIQKFLLVITVPVLSGNISPGQQKPANLDVYGLLSSPSRARTYNNSVNSRVLYHCCGFIPKTAMKMLHRWHYSWV